MANVDNLLKGNPDTQFKSGRNAAENGAKGGIASGIAKRQRKTLRETMLEVLDMPLDELKAFTKTAKENGTYLPGIDTRTAMTLALANKANQGDVQALKELRAWIGEDKQNVSVEIADNGLLAALTGQLPKSEDADVES